MKTVSKQMNVQSLGDRKEELTESAKNKLKQELNLRISKQLTPPNSKKIRKSLKKTATSVRSFLLLKLAYQLLSYTRIWMFHLSLMKTNTCQAYSLYQHALGQKEMTMLEIKAMLHYIDDENKQLLKIHSHLIDKCVFNNKTYENVQLLKE